MPLSRWAPVPLLLFGSASLCAQPGSIPLCIVQAKPDHATHYDPSAGPWAIEMYNQLTGQKLRGGSPLKITVLPATVQKHILPEVRRLHCDWVVQIWHHDVPDFSASPAGVSSGENFSPLNPLQAGPGPISNRESLFFSLWNVTTGKVLSTGSTPLHPRTPIDPPDKPDESPCTTFAHQVLKRMNQLR